MENVYSETENFPVILGNSHCLSFTETRTQTNKQTTSRVPSVCLSVCVQWLCTHFEALVFICTLSSVSLHL